MPVSDGEHGELLSDKEVASPPPPTVIHGSGKQAFPGSATELLISPSVNSRRSTGSSSVSEPSPPDLLRNCEDRRNEYVIAKFRISLSEIFYV